MKRSTPAKPGPDAFALLMGGSSKRNKTKSAGSPRTPSSFVLCPIGCGQHIAQSSINRHIDTCIGKQQEETKDKESPVTPLHGSPKHASKPANHIPQTQEDPIASNPEHKKPDVSTANSTTSNTFAHMMQRSSKIFSKKKDLILAERLHLDAVGGVGLTCYNVNPGESELDGVEWRSKVQLRPKKRPTKGSEGHSIEDEVPVVVDLVISSSIQSAARKKRLVQRHSRLSVPVLKSILQKAIRRRKPLPAVRVAMELADKALGDLLRRLPIIILEDSTLHPAFSFLVLLMIAHSKNFEPNDFLLRKVFCIVYEMASCPWQDVLKTSQDATDGQSGDTNDPSIQSYHKPGLDVVLEDHEILVWSMLVRAGYGGMSCDVSMLNEYAKVWKRRFESMDAALPESVLTRLSKSNVDFESLSWKTLPTQIHTTSIRQSSTRVEPMVKDGLRSLVFADITTEGVDFHCSPIMKFIMSDPEVVAACFAKLKAVTSESSTDTLPRDEREQRQWLEGMLKSCMWTYSAGVNRRLPLCPLHQKGAQEMRHEGIWKVIEQRARFFAASFVRERLY